MRFKSTATQSGIAKRLVLGFAALATTAVVGTAGMASAQHGIGGPQSSGYGGNNVNVNNNVNVGVSGDRNVIHIVINYIFN
jgi:hypothetical protein